VMLVNTIWDRCLTVDRTCP